MDLLVQAFTYLNTSSAYTTNILKKIGDNTYPLFHAFTAPARGLPSRSELLEKRKKIIGSKCQTFYESHPFIVSRASMQYLYDEEGRQFIDCISNVQHVGHCHPRVAEEISQQLTTSTCNVRFISDKLTECAEAILKTLPPQLDTMLFCNSGSEANDLAMRLARDFTGNTDMIVLDHAYHGHITSTMELSPYKFNHTGSSIAKPAWVHVAPVPDVYRGEVCRLSDEERRDAGCLRKAGRLYADEVQRILDEEVKEGEGVAAFIAEALQSCGGQIIPPPGYMHRVAECVRARGGLVIVDEVQTGFGRMGASTFWAHQLSDSGGNVFCPDIVTMGKPMGNGFPVAAVATRREIADKLGGTVGYFNTYGGNPVACAAALAVLNVLREDNLLEHASRMGKLFEKGLNELAERHECIGDVRGAGMFWGVDLVLSRETREPATQLAKELCLKLRKEYGVLLNADGPHTNILKFKPPMCFKESDLQVILGALDECLRGTEIRRVSQE